MMSPAEQSPPEKSNWCWSPMALLLPSPHPLHRPTLRKPELHKCVENFSRFLQQLLLTSQNPILKTFVQLSSPPPPHPPREFKMASSANFAAILPGDSVAGVVVANGVLNFLNIYNTLLVVRLVLTWFPNSPPAIVSPLSTLCDPYLNIFRGIIPPLGGTLDLSPILAFLVLNAFTSTASAIPAELPGEAIIGSSSPPAIRNRRSPTWFDGLTTSQRKWLSRLQSDKKSTK